MARLEFRMPSLGADMDAGTLVAWNVSVGEEVSRGQIVGVVETDKGAIDIEIWQAGTIERLLVGVGEKVPVGTVLATLTGEGSEGTGEEGPPANSPGERAPLTVATPTVVASEATVSAAPQPVTRGRVSPAARRLATELGVDADSLKPSAPDGVIGRADVERAARAAQPARADNDWHAQMRRAIAAAMARSKREIPHYYLATEIDMSRALAWLEQENARKPVAERMLYAVLLLKAMALAAREVPGLNGFWKDERFEPGRGVHIGMAVTMRGGGLVAPAIHDADRKSLPELMGELRDLIMRVRGGRLRSSELADPTITLTSLGDQGVETVYGVIYPPQVAVVGAGCISERPVAANGVIECRRRLTVTLAADHRASDGHRGARFLGALARLLQEPETLA